MGIMNSRLSQYLTLIYCSKLFSLSLASFLPVCEQGKNCLLPNCFCSTFYHNLFDPEDIPQIVYFGFDDGAKPGAEAYLDRLFGHERKNPNKCPISVTLYVSGDNHDYSGVNRYSRRGFEIAIKSTHQDIDPSTESKIEVKRQKANIIKLSNVTEGRIHGWRSPYQKTVGDYQIRTLQNNDFTYDVTLGYTRHKMADSNPWPFTLDYGWTLPCNNHPCPRNKHPGFWVVPVNAMRDYGDWGSCEFVDSCVNKPLTENKTYNYIMDNFRSHYHGNRAPFGIHIHESLFTEKTVFLNGLDKAIQDLLKYEDVYIVSINQTLEWMKRPTKLRSIDSFRPWSCSESDGGISLPGVVIFLIIVVMISIYVRIMTKLFT
ncbi:chitin deacetylase 7-like [Argopecten irradians]|uniref:chitin deacetylase 7-like n=1 Tax=Argopecten irradians TaxID=31199 RepID=UPI0037190690